ncbi:hypothetical protein [Georgenia wangjunii]|uniref:hypothetical protein n=1 Tax=Georgenia wangjunii TaxID=3117730 RepID=UPI002F2684CC
MSTGVLLAVTGAREGELVRLLDAPGTGVRVVRRCADVPEVLAAALAGLGAVAVLSGDLAGVDRTLVGRLTAAGVRAVLVAAVGDAERCRGLGARVVLDARSPVTAWAEAVQAAAVADAAPDADASAGASAATPGAAGRDPAAPGPGRPCAAAPGGAGTSTTGPVPAGPDADGAASTAPAGLGPAAASSTGPGGAGATPRLTDASPGAPGAMGASRVEAEQGAGAGAPGGPRRVRGSRRSHGASPAEVPGAPVPGSPRAVADSTGGTDGADGAGGTDGAASAGGADDADDGARPGRLVVVWGPPGAPGRTTVAVNLAAELAAAGGSCLLVDADTEAPSVAQVLGLLDETAGIAAAARAAANGRLDRAALARACLTVDGFRVLSGLTRADRWRELPPTSLEVVWERARELAAWTVVDTGAGIEGAGAGFEASFGPRRHQATLSALAAADVVVVVGAGEPVGIHRLVTALHDLADRAVCAPGAERVVLVNRVRVSAAGPQPERSIHEALVRFAGVEDAVLVPDDRAALDRCVLVGETLVQGAQGSPARAAFTGLAARLAGTAVTRKERRRAARTRRRGQH